MDGRTDRILIARPRLHSMQRGNKMGAQKTYEAKDSFIGSKTIIGTAYLGTEGWRLICVSVQLYIADFVSTYTYTSERDVSSRY